MARIDRPSTDVLVSNIETVYRLASKADIFEGLAWYGVALAECSHVATRTGVSLVKAVAVVAATSPQTPWARNIAIAEGLIVAWQHGLPLHGHTTAVCEKVAAILALPDTDTAGILDAVQGKTGFKTRNFAANILGVASGLGDVTVDRHAIGVAYNRVFGDNTPSLTKGQYLAIADAYTAVGQAHGLSGVAVQAITWLAWRRIHGIEEAYGR